MKRRKLLYITLTLVVLFALIVIGIARSSLPDIELVKGVPPVYTLYTRSEDGTYSVYRIYNVHVPYDKAALSAMNDRRTKGWRNTEMGFMRTVFASPDDKQHVYVAREYMIADVPVRAASTGVEPRESMALLKPSIDSSPDPHGWVTVTTDGRMPAGIGLLKYWSHVISARLSRKRMRSFAHYAIMPKGGQPGDRVDVTKGTAHMEGEPYVRGFMTTDD